MRTLLCVAAFSVLTGCKPEVKQPGLPPQDLPEVRADRRTGTAPTAALPPSRATDGKAPADVASRVVTEAEMREVQRLTQSAFDGDDKTPIEDRLILEHAAWATGGSAAAARIKEGAIVVTYTSSREGVWAYETRAITAGGLVATSSGVETMTAAELQRRLGK